MGEGGVMTCLVGWDIHENDRPGGQFLGQSICKQSRKTRTTRSGPMTSFSWSLGAHSLRNFKSRLLSRRCAKDLENENRAAQLSLWGDFSFVSPAEQPTSQNAR
jgi:hypothetical protein